MRRKLFLAVISILIVGAITGTLIIKSEYVAPILMYHSMDERYKESKLSVCPRSFEQQLKFLHDHNYNVVSLKKLVDMIETNTSLPAKTVVITFDDGYENNYTCAYPLLKKYNMPATIFVVINNVGKEGCLNWYQINEMLQSGLISIGSHTLSHSYLPSVTDKMQLYQEIFQSKRLLQRLTGQKDIFFSYPVGGFNEEIRALVKETGYTAACATNPGKRYPDNDIYALKRIRISRTSDNMLIFWIESSGYYTFIKEIRDED